MEPGDSIVSVESGQNQVAPVVKYVDYRPLEVSIFNVRGLTLSFQYGGADNLNGLPFYHPVLVPSLSASTLIPTHPQSPSQRERGAN